MFIVLIMFGGIVLKDDKTAQTGLKLILLLKFLYENDMAKDEILKHFTKFYNISLSQETLKLYINTLIEAGFKIKRGNRGNNFKLHLEKDFSILKLSQKELIMLDAIRNYVFETMDINKIMALESFYKKLLPCADEKGQALLKNFRFFNIINKKVLDGITTLNKGRNWAKVRYISPKRGVVEISCKLNGTYFTGGKLYLRCTVNSIKEDIMLRADNIYGIFKTDERPEAVKFPREKINYKFKKQFAYDNILDDKEIFIKTTKNEAEIEAERTNDFFTVQKLILAGKNCTEIDNNEIKEKVIKQLSEILEQYR